MLALDTFYVNGMLTLLMLRIRSATTVYFNIALLIALFGLVGSVALAKFLLRGCSRDSRASGELPDGRAKKDQMVAGVLRDFVVLRCAQW